MTFDQAQEAFRERRTSTTADAYLDIALHDKADHLIGDDAFFSAVGEVASWLSAPNFGAVRSRALIRGK
jgi:hypothetical protein